jgi:hypothetical protein
MGKRLKSGLKDIIGCWSEEVLGLIFKKVGSKLRQNGGRQRLIEGVYCVQDGVLSQRKF